MNNKVIITSYFKNQIALSNKDIITGNSILIDDGNNISLDVKDVESFLLDKNNYNFLDEYSYKKEILIVGYGKKLIIPSFEIRSYIASKGLSLEWVTTIAAYDTFNLLVEENRSCLAVLINNCL